MSDHLQKAMYDEIRDRSLFELATSYAQEFISTAFDRNVYPTEEALTNLNQFDEDIPQQPGDAKEILSFLHRHGSPAAVTQIGGRYFGFVNGSVVPAGLAAKNLAIYWDQNTAMQVLSPISSKLEQVVQRWLVQLLGLPADTVAGFVSGSSMANFCGLAAARYRILKNQDWELAEKGLFGAPKVRIVTCTQAHSTVLKAISLLGLGKGNIEWVDVDDEGRIIPEQIPPLDSQTILILQAGNVNSGAFDDFEQICRRAKDQGAWIHVDGAFGLWAAATQNLRHLTSGYQLADSWTVDGHKTLNTPYDSGIVLCADQEALVSALHMTGDYIVTGHDRDGMFFTPEMSRRARVVELWATLRYLGWQGVDELVQGLHERARQFTSALSDAEGFQVLNDVVFNQVLVSCASDELTDKVIAKVQELRTCWVGGSFWNGRRVIRISVCSWATTPEDVSRSADSFKEALAQVLRSNDHV
ncbi:MAG: aspartate aminotransferase family protein [Cyclobacteriaceae bacterium]|nr:aspartate aminotransferase family protein [Cyclobacteriaceae bacterium HetDA_MAG_MS6]